MVSWNQYCVSSEPSTSASDTPLLHSVVAASGTVKTRRPYQREGEELGLVDQTIQPTRPTNHNTHPPDRPTDHPPIHPPCVRKNSTRRASAVVLPPQGPPVSTILKSLGIPSLPTSPPLLCVASVRPPRGELRPLLMLPLCGALPKAGGDSATAGGGPLPLPPLAALASITINRARLCWGGGVGIVERNYEVENDGSCHGSIRFDRLWLLSWPLSLRSYCDVSFLFCTTSVSKTAAPIDIQKVGRPSIPPLAPKITAAAAAAALCPPPLPFLIQQRPPRPCRRRTGGPSTPPCTSRGACPKRERGRRS